VTGPIRPRLTHQPLAAVIGEFVGMAAEQGGHLGVNGLDRQCLKSQHSKAKRALHENLDGRAAFNVFVETNSRGEPVGERDF
jgi:hypothetical protein